MRSSSYRLAIPPFHRRLERPLPSQGYGFQVEKLYPAWGELAARILEIPSTFRELRRGNKVTPGGVSKG